MKSLSEFAHAYCADKSGATAIEYGMLIGVLSLALIVGGQGMGLRITDIWDSVSNRIGAV